MAKPDTKTQNFTDDQFETVSVGDFPAYWECDADAGGFFFGIPVAFDDRGETEYGPVRRVVFKAVRETECLRGEGEPVTVAPGEFFTLLVRKGLESFSEAFIGCTVKVTQKPARAIKGGKTFLPYQVDVLKSDMAKYQKALKELGTADTGKVPSQLMA